MAACDLLPREAAGSLPPTLTVRDVSGGSVAFQDGLAVPTFNFQPRPRIDLGGRWPIELTDFDADQSLTRRSLSLRGIESAAGGRQLPSFPDTTWRRLQVPGSWNPPPAGDTAPSGAWYRRHFTVPPAWAGTSITLKFASVNYVADVWLNGHYLGYHEGGSTPFAFDASQAAVVGADNVLAVRVDVPSLGTRNDILPWGLTDWWNYAGITGAVWLESTETLAIARADVFPHLDGADVSAVLANRSQSDEDVTLRLEVLPAFVTAANLTNPDPRSLLAPRLPVVTVDQHVGILAAGATQRVNASFSIAEGDLWSPASPALYVLRATLLLDTIQVDQLYETFGLRTIAVSPHRAQLLLNATPVSFTGVAAHDEQVSPPVNGEPRGGPLALSTDYLALLGRAQAAGADFIRADHHPPNPLLLMLADRLGFAVWEEIPLYHYTPATFDIAMGRGLPQQSMAEMVLRDQDHPSVLFHGFANESTGGAQRAAALTQLRDLDRELDGTRLTGQAAYGFDLNDATSSSLDVAGYTFYYGVFYGGPPGAATERALAAAHARYPNKPIIILEFGRWADTRTQEPVQKQVLVDTYQALERHADTGSGGYLGAAVWWSLDDYWTMRPGIKVEHFGLYRPDGATRQAGLAATQLFGHPAGKGPQLNLVSHGRGSVRATGESFFLLSVIGYALVGTFLILFSFVVGLALLTRWQSPTPARANP